MTVDSNDWTFDACRERLREATRIIIDAEKTYEAAIERKADAAGVFRSELAKAYKVHREAGKAVEESNTLARRDTAVHERERDYAADMVKLRADQLEDARDSRRSLWRLVEWARGRDLATLGKADEREPAERWP